jgi:SNF2 family DNA or RNA helicase
MQLDISKKKKEDAESCYYFGFYYRSNTSLAEFKQLKLPIQFPYRNMHKTITLIRAIPLSHLRDSTLVSGDTNRNITILDTHNKCINGCKCTFALYQLNYVIINVNIITENIAMTDDNKYIHTVVHALHSVPHHSYNCHYFSYTKKNGSIVPQFNKICAEFWLEHDKRHDNWYGRHKPIELPYNYMRIWSHLLLTTERQMQQMPLYYFYPKELVTYYKSLKGHTVFYATFIDCILLLNIPYNWDAPFLISKHPYITVNWYVNPVDLGVQLHIALNPRFLTDITLNNLAVNRTALLILNTKQRLSINEYYKCDILITLSNLIVEHCPAALTTKYMQFDTLATRITAPLYRHQYENIEWMAHIEKQVAERTLLIQSCYKYDYGMGYDRYSNTLTNINVIDYNGTNYMYSTDDNGLISELYTEDVYINKFGITLYACGGILSDTVGSGKTLSCIAHILQQLNADKQQLRKNSSAYTYNNLIVLPARLVFQWINEFTKYVKTSESVKILVFKTMRDINKYKDTATAAVALATSDIIIVNNRLFQNADYLAQSIMRFEQVPQWNRVFIDEAHEVLYVNRDIARCKIKLGGGHNARICAPATTNYEILHTIKANYKWCVTATPLYYGLCSFYGLMAFLMEPIYSATDTPRQRQCEIIKYYNQYLNPSCHPTTEGAAVTSVDSDLDASASNNDITINISDDSDIITTTAVGDCAPPTAASTIQDATHIREIEYGPFDKFIANSVQSNDAKRYWILQSTLLSKYAQLLYCPTATMEQLFTQITSQKSDTSSVAIVAPIEIREQCIYINLSATERQLYNAITDCSDGTAVLTSPPFEYPPVSNTTASECAQAITCRLLQYTSHTKCRFAHQLCTNLLIRDYFNSTMQHLENSSITSLQVASIEVSDINTLVLSMITKLEYDIAALNTKITEQQHNIDNNPIISPKYQLLYATFRCCLHLYMDKGILDKYTITLKRPYGYTDYKPYKSLWQVRHCNFPLLRRHIMQLFATSNKTAYADLDTLLHYKPAVIQAIDALITENGYKCPLLSSFPSVKHYKPLDYLIAWQLNMELYLHHKLIKKTDELRHTLAQKTVLLRVFQSNRVAHISEQLAEPCVICYDTIQQAILTTCRHLFCEACYSIFINKFGSTTPFPCPICRQLVSSTTITKINQPVINAIPRTAAIIGGHGGANAPPVIPPIMINSVQLKEGWHAECTNKYGTKMMALLVFLSELLNSDPTNRIIIFSQYHSMLKLIGRILSCYSIQFVYCEGHVFSMNASLTAFQSDPATRIILLSSEDSNSGIHLTAANHVILVDVLNKSPTEALAAEQQAIGRAVRIGQLRPVTITRFITRNTVEEYLINRTLTP